MQWIDVHKDLPKDGERVLVLALSFDPEDNPLCQKRKPLIFEGKFFRESGWRLIYHPEARVYVRYWQQRPSDPEDISI